MNLIRRIKVWWRGLRRRRAAGKKKAPLREFVYLDEVSVYSLLASRLGPIATEFTETETATLQGEVSSAVGASSGIAKAEVGSRIGSGHTTGTQVVRKSVVQTAFKELYELEEHDLVLRPRMESELPPPPSDWDALPQAGVEEPLSAFVLSSETMRRGFLFEAEVELSADPVFQISTVVSSLLELFNESPELFGPEILEDISTASSVGRVLEKMLVGLVPLRGRVLDYEVLELGGTEWIAHRSLASELSAREGIVRRDLFIVGVAEEALFWKDIRRVLFSKSQFRVLCRIGKNGLRESWTPVKLADVLAEVSPDIGAQLDHASSTAIGLMQKTGAGKTNDSKRIRRMEAALVRYGCALAKHHGEIIPYEELEAEAEEPAAERDFLDIQSRRHAFAAITKYVDNLLGVTTDPLTAAHLREAALIGVGFSLDGKFTAGSTAQLQGGKIDDDARYLDSEIVAIYW